MLSFGFDTCIKVNSLSSIMPDQRYFAGCQAMLQSDAIGYEPVGIFLPQGEFSTLFFSETPMSPEHFLLVLQSGDWGVCEL